MVLFLATTAVHLACAPLLGLCRRFGIMDAVGCVGQTAFQTLGHPPKERFDGSLC